MTLTPKPGWRGDPTFLPEVLRAFGVKVNEMPGWRNIGHGDFDRIQGIIVHHTGTNKNIPGYIQNHPQLGLCSQIHLSTSGVADLCGVGIAYHAGLGSYPGWPTNAANQVAIGIEAASDGVTPWPSVQMEAYYAICAAILWFLGKRATTATVLSHAEYSGKAQGKWDPGAGSLPARPIDMGRFRAEVNKRIDNPPWVKKGLTVSEADRIIKEVKDYIDIRLTGPVGSDVKDIRQQITGGRNRGEYPGWAQLGFRTVVDALGVIGVKLGIPGFFDVKNNEVKEITRG